MPSYIVTLKKGATDADKKSFKDHVQSQGGKIGHEYALINGYSVEYPKDQLNTLETYEHVATCEPDGEVKTQ